jgi:hypothetical protein
MDRKPQLEQQGSNNGIGTNSWRNIQLTGAIALTRRSLAPLLLATAFAGCADDRGLSAPGAPEAPAAAPEKGNRLFFDDFQTGEPMAKWTPFAGEWDIQDLSAQDKEYKAPLQILSQTVAGNLYWTDYQVEAKVTIEDDAGKVGLLGRVQDTHYYYEFLLGRDGEGGERSWFIRRRYSHTWETLASGAFGYEMGIPYVMRFTLQGERLKALISADAGRSFIELGAATDATYKFGKIGLGSYFTRARFDDVAVDGDFIYQQSGPWGPVALLRDNTNTFAGKPSGGWYVTPIHANLRASDGKVMITGFGRKAEPGCNGSTQRQVGESWILDPAVLDATSDGQTLFVSPLNEQNADPVHEVLYCAGHNTLADGRIFYSAGTRYPNTLPDSSPELGLAYSRIFSPSTGTFTRITANMAGGQASSPGMKWYPTNLLLPDGRVLMYGGFHWSGGGPDSKTNHSFELFDPSVWDANPNANPYTVLTQHTEGNSQISPTRGYTNLFLLPKPVPAGTAGGGLARSVVAEGGFGRVFLYNHEPGPSGAARLIARTNALTPNVSTNEKGEGASGAMMPDGTIMFAGGGHDGVGSSLMYFYNPYSDSWTTLDPGASGRISRMYGDATWLPDGTILILNGYNNNGAGFQEPGNEMDITNPVGDVRRPQLIDPFANPRTIINLPAWPEPTGRGYHAIALLLKDGRILVGGGKDGAHITGCEKNELRIFSPPYLSAGPRPSITKIAGTTGEGQTLSVGSSPVTIEYTGTIRSTRGVVLMAPGGLTHGFDENQRYVPLTATIPNPQNGTLTITPPASINEAQPGEYVLYVISDLGVPSVGKFVRLAAPPPCTYAVNGSGDSYIEAEASSRSAGPFAKITDATRSAGAYIEVTQGTGNFTTVPDEGRVMWYDLNVTNGGAFNVWMLTQGLTTSDDSFWVSMDGTADLRPTPDPAAAWGWQKVGTTTINIPTGKHQLKIKVREDGTRVDKVLLTKNTALTPSGLGGGALACSEAPPTAPTMFVANDGVGQVAMTWVDTSSNETGFKIERKPQGQPDTSYMQVGTAAANATSFTDMGVAAGVYTYRVKSTNAAGDSGSNADDATVTAAQPPSAPTNFVANDGVGQVTMTWTDTSSNETGFKIERKPQGQPDTSYMQVGTAAINATSYTNTGVAAGVYTYRVKSTNAAGDSASNADDATVTVPSIGFANLVVNDTAVGGDSTPNNQQWSVQANFAVGNTAFGDRTYTIDAVSTGATHLLGKPWVRPAADSKSYTPTSPPLGTVTVNGSNIFIAVDSRHATTFLTGAGFASEGYTITVRESSTVTRTYNVWKKAHTSGATFTFPTVGATIAPCYLTFVE